MCGGTACDNIEQAVRDVDRGKTDSEFFRIIDPAYQTLLGYFSMFFSSKFPDQINDRIVYFEFAFQNVL